jgi:hypothetical protein
MSRQIPIFVEPGYESTFNESRRNSEPLGGQTRPHRFEDSDRIESEFEDASKRFFEKNLNRRRHSEYPDRTSWERDLNSHSPPIYQDRPFGRRGSNSTSSSCSSPSWRRDHFDELIQRMTSEDSDNFDFSHPEFGNFRVEKKREKFYSPEDTSKNHEKVRKSPSAPDSSTRKHRDTFDRQSSTPSTGTNYAMDENGCFEIPVLVRKDDDTAEEKTGKNDGGKMENGKPRDESVTQNKVKEVHNGSECLGSEKGEEGDTELIVTISVDSVKKDDTENEEKVYKGDESTEKQDVRNQEIQSVKSTKIRENEEEIPEESHQDALEQLSKIKSIEAELEKVLEKAKKIKATGTTDNKKEYLWLEEQLMRTLMGLDAIEANGSKRIREERKAVVKRVQEALNKLEKKWVPASKQKT